VRRPSGLSRHKDARQRHRLTVTGVRVRRILIHAMSAASGTGR